MRRFLPKVFLILSFVFLFLILQKQAFANFQITTTPEKKPKQPSTDQAKKYIFGNVYDYENNIVTENTQTVHIAFSGLPNTTYNICLEKGCLNGLGWDFFDTSSDRTRSGSEFILHVCADGKDKLKLVDDECSEKDYFWGGHVYSVGIITKDDQKIVETASFYVSRYYPDVRLPNVHAEYTPGMPIAIHIGGIRRPFGEDNYKETRNNYAIEIARSYDVNKVYSQICKSIPEGIPGEVIGIDIPIAKKGLKVGDYIVKISEQVHEGELFRGGCTTGFTYYWLKIRVRNQKFWDTHDIAFNSLVKTIPDPNGEDVPGSKKGKNIPPPPCATNFRELDGGTCPEVMTGLGIIIKTEPVEFIGSIFSIVLSLAGGIAVLLIILSGYQMVASQGNPEKLEEARQQLVSAIAGLLFLILSLVILQVIGIDILRLNTISGGGFGT